MKNLARQGASNPEIQNLALSLAGLDRIELFLRSHWCVQPDPDDTEYIRTPQLEWELYKEHGCFVGDCDDGATMAGALILAAGYWGALTAIRLAGQVEFSHVWLVAVAAPAPSSGAPWNVVHFDVVTPAEAVPITNFAESMIVYLQ